MQFNQHLEWNPFCRTLCLEAESAAAIRDKLSLRTNMKTAVISYSFTGNNKALAERDSLEFSDDHINMSAESVAKYGS